MCFHCGRFGQEFFVRLCFPSRLLFVFVPLFFSLSWLSVNHNVFPLCVHSDQNCLFVFVCFASGLLFVFVSLFFSARGCCVLPCVSLCVNVAFVCVCPMVQLLCKRNLFSLLLACLHLADVPGLCAYVDVTIDEKRRKVCFLIALCVSVSVNVAFVCVCPMVRLLCKRNHFYFSVSVFAPRECCCCCCCCCCF